MSQNDLYGVNAFPATSFQPGIYKVPLKRTKWQDIDLKKSYIGLEVAVETI